MNADRYRSEEGESDVFGSKGRSRSRGRVRVREGKEVRFVVIRVHPRLNSQ
jgi:hypothetical protein